MSSNHIQLVAGNASSSVYERRRTQHVTLDGIVVMSFKPNTHSTDYLAIDIEGRYIEDSSKKGGTDFYRAYRVANKSLMINCFELIKNNGDFPSPDKLAQRRIEEGIAEQKRYNDKLESNRLWRIGQYSSELFSMLNNLVNNGDVVMDEASELRNEIQANIDTSIRSVSETFDYRKGFTYTLHNGTEMHKS